MDCQGQLGTPGCLTFPHMFPFQGGHPAAHWQNQAGTQSFSAGPGLDRDLNVFLGKALKASAPGQETGQAKGEDLQLWEIHTLAFWMAGGFDLDMRAPV